jgi:hypothetical protein
MTTGDADGDIHVFQPIANAAWRSGRRIKPNPNFFFAIYPVPFITI